MIGRSQDNMHATFSHLTDVKSVISILSEISIFGGLIPVQREEIFGRLECGIIEKGSYVFRKGDEPTHIYIVKAGSIDLSITDGEIVFEKKQLGVGECFGEASLMSMHRHTSAAFAMEDTELIVLSRHALIELQREDIHLFALLMMNIARELARRLQVTDDILLRVLHGHPISSDSKPLAR